MTDLEQMAQQVVEQMHAINSLYQDIESTLRNKDTSNEYKIGKVAVLNLQIGQITAKWT